MRFPQNHGVQTLKVTPFRLRSNEDKKDIMITGCPISPITITTTKKVKQMPAPQPYSSSLNGL